MDGHGPKLVSKVSDSYDAVQQNSKKHHARAPSRAKSDDPLSKNNDFGTHPGIPPDPADPADPPETVSACAARTPLPHAPEARMTVVTQTPSNDLLHCFRRYKDIALFVKVRVDALFERRLQIHVGISEYIEVLG